jgi:Excalibur calcium-binding domain
MGDRGDPQGPWQDYGGDTRGGERARAPLPVPTPRPAVPPARWSPGWSDDHGHYSEEWGYEDEPDDEDGDGPVRRAAGELVWRYRSAPLWLRATLDVTAVALILAVVVGGVMAMRSTAPSDEVGAFVAPTSTTVRPAGTPTSAPVPLGGSITTTATEPVRPSTTTTAPTTTVAPPTTPVPPEPPTTTTPERGNPNPGSGPHYDNCFQAWRAGALPLHRGDPGYAPHLDDDNDGTACEWGEGF